MFAATKKIAPKVIKQVTPWYIRWIYSICGDQVTKMATSSIAPENTTGGGTSDSVVCFKSFDWSISIINWNFFFE